MQTLRNLRVDLFSEKIKALIILKLPWFFPPIVPSSPKPENYVELESVCDQDSVFGAVDGDVQPGISMFIMLIY